MAKTADYGLGEFTYPRGWFMIADANELPVGGKPLAVRYFGQDLALYRGKSGKVVMLDAYCPHMGTHLTKNTTSYVIQDGQIEEDSIRCPYHAWRFGADGKCDHIPYYDGPIPKAAAVKSWPVREEMGALWTWYDPEGQAPDYDLPVLAEWNDPAWVHWTIDYMGELDCHQQEIVDNMADYPHLEPVHGSIVKYFQNEMKGHTCVQYQGGPHKTLVTADGAILETRTWYTGPAILLSEMKGEYPSYIMITHTPIEDGRVKAWHALLVKMKNPVATEADKKEARVYQIAARDAFAQDFEIWANKKPAINIMQIPTDGPFNKNRLWYKQFYNPRARAREFLDQVEGTHLVRGMPAAPSRKAAE